MTAPLTRQLAEFAVRMATCSIPDAAREWVRVGFTDCVGVMLAGRSEPVTRLLVRTCREQGGVAQSRVCLGGERMSASDAALVTATAAHALDWDDYAFVNHPSAVLVPTVLAAGEPVGASGDLVTRAYVAGYETWAALMLREPDHIHSKGWHPTGVFGPVGAAAAASVIMRLDVERTSIALALAGSFAGGLMANFGTMTKPLHGGRAAQSGVWAARLAAAGMTASPEAIESPTGLLNAVSPRGAVDRTTPLDRIGHDWTITRLGLNIKKFPTVGASQRSIDALLELRTREAIDPARVKTLRPRLSTRQSLVMPFHRPTTALQAKFSLEFICAAALVAGRVGLSELTDAFVQRQDVQDLIRRVEIETTEENDPNYPGAAPFDVVRVVLDDDTELVSQPVHRASGHADRPLSVGERWAKFADGASTAECPEALARRAFDMLARIDELTSVELLPDLN